MKKIYLLSLGCPRNLLDSEVLLALLEKKGFKIVEDPRAADVAIVNTCGFIEDAKQESINMILHLANLKKDKKIKKLVVAGCLSQRYPSELMDEIKEIDGIFGTSDFTKIPEALNALLSGERIKEVDFAPDFLYDHLSERTILTPRHYIYLKIQEGCSNRCSYCVIPDLKGPRRSRTVESVLEEVKQLKKKYGPKELVLIGQDTTSFGIDRSGGSELAELLRKVSPLMKGGWVRLLYAHPACFTDELIEVIAGTENICKYVDLPVQHISDKILKKMNRSVTREEITALIERLRNRIKGVAIRSSVIVGFPGETDSDFKELMDFLEDIRFDRLGAFIYSREEGTPAAGFDGHLPGEVKRKRFDEVMRLQQGVSAENNLRFIGKELKVLIDEKDPFNPAQFLGRSEMDAPEVDGTVHVKGKGVKVGDFIKARITGTMEYDLIGESL